jgi:hypothetical protein
VGVAGDDGGDAFVIVGCPFVEAIVNFVAEARVGYLTGAFGVRLVAMDHKNLIIQDDAFVDLNP